MKHELPVTARIARVILEAEGIRSVILPVRTEVRPGQFAMLWLPGVDAKPVGISYHTPETVGFTVSAVGPWSERICALREGDLLGFLGPYGNGFTLRGRRIIVIGGGYGAASLLLLAEEALRSGLEITMVIGARTERRLLYRRRAADLGLPAVFATDDGSFGVAGRTSDVLERILVEQSVDTVYACGPEMMEKKVAEICAAAGVASQISLERHMKCGFGVCGACCVDRSGARVCVEGPVFSGEEALRIEEFGCYHRDGSAAKHFF
ncbi:MAG: dihydroorotate dehydrogenase electron transfer subunit [Planctomycetes bacterium]|nr:dihydroorotate dehydrogenase electron transfer subunit [Planctomycetota bacterium]